MEEIYHKRNIKITTFKILQPLQSYTQGSTDFTDKSMMLSEYWPNYLKSGCLGTGTLCILYNKDCDFNRTDSSM